ncbi:hypothetical protein ANTQUA_LOCUS4969 [Anthophora quadrimaculata]
MRRFVPIHIGRVFTDEQSWRATQQLSHPSPSPNRSASFSYGTGHDLRMQQKRKRNSEGISIENVPTGPNVELIRKLASFYRSRCASAINISLYTLNLLIGGMKEKECIISVELKKMNE